MALKVGYRFNTKGYDVKAVIQTAESGDTIEVLNNNSTHFLVVLHDHDSYIDEGSGHKYAVLLAMFTYNGDENDDKVVYAQALNRAVSEAIGR